MPNGYVYILGSTSGTLYVGITNDLSRRILEHKQGIGSNFASRYGCDRLLLYEAFDDIRNAIAREKFIKGKTRAKKLALIQAANPEFKDLAEHAGWLRIGPQQTMKDTDAAMADWQFLQKRSRQK